MSATANPQQDDDARLSALMAAAQAGERRAYETLLRDSMPVIRRVARRTGAAGDRVEDVVQDVLLTIHRVRQTYDPARSYTAWLTAIAQRRTIDLLRRTGRQGVRELHAPLAYESHPDEDDPARTAEAKGEAERLRAAIATLPEAQRQAVERLGLEESSLEDVSRETGRTKTSLKVNLHRAIKALRGRLSPDGKDVD
jgi:RNA polymerase sigma-70 factor (ECF subfamily)